MFRLITLLATFASLTACDAISAPGSTTVAVPLDAHTSNLQITESGLIYHQRALKLGAPMADWIEVLGPDFRRTQPNTALTVLVWDKLGIRVYPDYRNETVSETVTIVLAHMDSTSAGYDVSAPGDGLEPQAVFRETLSVNGLSVSADSTVRGLRSSAGAAWIFSCMPAVATCSMRRNDQPDKQMAVSIAVDYRIENSPLYSLEIQRIAW